MLVEIKDETGEADTGGGAQEDGGAAAALAELGLRAADDFNQAGARYQLFLNPPLQPHLTPAGPFTPPPLPILPGAAVH